MWERLHGLIVSAGWENIARSALEIALIYLVLYLVFRLVHGTRGAGVLRGLIFLIVLSFVGILFVVKHFHLYAIEWLFTEFLPIFIVPIVVILQPEFRRALVRIGQNPLFRLFFRGESTVVDEIVAAATSLSEKRIGALIAIEREIQLGAVIERGTLLDAQLSSALIETIFTPGTPLHDGAIVVREQRIAAAGCVLPLSETPSGGTKMGTRHRAALGVTEETDAVAVVVSEETGSISVAVRGQMTRDLDADSLRKMLNELALETVNQKTQFPQKR